VTGSVTAGMAASPSPAVYSSVASALRAFALRALCCVIACGLAGPHGTAVEIPPPKPLDHHDRLRTKGRDIVDGHGHVVTLRGVNVGGWLVTEGWMCGQTDNGGRGALEQLEARFGPEKAARLMAAWQDHWFTSKDLDLIQSWGFNLIRVPFSYRTLQDAEGNWKRRPDGGIDFSRMDWVVDEAGRRGIHVIFDLHVWPRQLEQGKYGLPSRWSDEGKVVREQMRKLWSEVAKHYKDNGIIAGFDVINEPEGSPWNAPHHAFHDVIREQDPDRMVIVEWSGYANTPKEFPNNTVYSDHYAFKDAESLEKYLGSLRAHPEVKVPVFLGEMKAGKDDAESARWMAEAMNKEGWNWAVWTYKGVTVGGWAAFNYDASMRYDLSTDSYESLLAKWEHGLTQWQDPARPKNSSITQWWVDGFRHPRPSGPPR
jgi:endoglucanase